jgi:hypothetical protein
MTTKSKTIRNSFGSSTSSSERPCQKIDASRLKINGSDKVFKTLQDYVTWPFGQKDPRLVARYYRSLEKAKAEGLPESPF